MGFLGFAGRDVGKTAAARTGNEPDNDHTDSSPTTQIVRLFHLSFDEGNKLADPKPFSRRRLAAVHRSAFGPAPPCLPSSFSPPGLALPPP